MSLFICIFLRWRIYLLSATWFIGKIMSRPKISWPGLFSLVLWYVDCTAKAAASRIPINGSASSTYASCRLNVRTRFLSTLFILYIIAFACGFLEGSGLVLKPYSFSIRIFLNSRPRNYPHRSYVISTGHVYLNSYIVSTKLTIVINFLSLYCVISKHTGIQPLLEWEIIGIFLWWYKFSACTRRRAQVLYYSFVIHVTFETSKMY